MSQAGLESSLTGFFLSAAAKTDAHWYSVKSLSEGVPSLASLLGMSNDNLDLILSLSGFSQIQKGVGLVFLSETFKNFLVMSNTKPFCEHTVFKLQGFSKSQHFIRVGAVNMLNICLVANPLLFFRTGTGVVAGASGKFCLIGFCHVFTALGISLTSVVYHFEFPPGISEGLLPGVVT
jgi:hypothetical protein